MTFSGPACRGGTAKEAGYHSLTYAVATAVFLFTAICGWWYSQPCCACSVLGGEKEGFSRNNTKKIEVKQK